MKIYETMQVKTVISCSPHLSGIRDRARNLDCFCFVFDLPHSNLSCLLLLNTG